MEEIYIQTAKALKAISDPKRLRIIDMLSCEELCACRILESFAVSQPTLSHDMKVLIEAGLVRERKQGKNIYYSLNRSGLESLQSVLEQIARPKEQCICHQKG